MLAIAVRYLCGWAMAAADGAVKQHPEWPPHPDRLFMALTAARHEGECGEKAAAALAWLECQGPPVLLYTQATYRSTVTHYVPVNDTQAPKLKAGQSSSATQLKKGLSLLPENRSRQPRQFPVAIPADPDVYFVWPDAQGDIHRGGLEHLCRNVTALGHSASLVQAWVSDRPPSPALPLALAPTNGVGERRLRVPGRGRLAYLHACRNQTAIDDYADLVQRRRQAKGKQLKAIKQELNERFPDGPPQWLRPAPAHYQDYRSVTSLPPPQEPAMSLFDHRLLVLRRTSGHALGLESTLLLTDAFHKTLLSRSGDPIPEWISGHRPDGGPSREPHLAMFPLPHIDHPHADGHLLGLAIAVPREIPATEVRNHLAWLARYDEIGEPLPATLYQGADFDWEILLEQSEFPPRALDSDTWTRPSHCWATVTPLVFDRHPKKGDRAKQLAEMVSLACKRIGLPSPNSVTFTDVSPFLGVPHRSSFPPMLRKTDGGRMRHGHATLYFDQPVRGPVLLGAGRFRGYGLCRPLRAAPEG